MVRGLIALLATFLIAFQLTVVVIGYQEYGTYAPIGTLEPIDAFRTRILDVSPEGQAAGAQARDVIDTRLMTIPQRLADFTHAWKGGASLPMTLYHADGTSVVNRTAVFAGWSWSRALDLFIRVLVFTLGLFLIARGEGRAGIWAGVALVGFGLSEGYGFNWGAVPLEAGIAGFIIQAFGFIPAYAGSYFFASSYVQAQDRRMPVALAIVFWTFFSFMAVMLAIERIGMFNGYDALNGARYLHLSQLLCTLALIVVFGVAAANTSSAASVRVLFWSYLVGAVGLECNQVAQFLGYQPPLDGALYLLYAVFAAGITYTVFAKRRTAITLTIGRASIYTVVIAIAAALFALLERTIGGSGIDASLAFVLELAVPLAFGILLRPVARGLERVVDIVLYREKLHARRSLAGLVDDLPHMLTTSNLEESVVEDVRRYMRCTFTVLYRESVTGYEPVSHDGGDGFATVRNDDRAFLRMKSTLGAVMLSDVDTELRGAIAVPLDVGGQITGALILGPRERDEPYDRDEIAEVATCAHVLGVTLLRLERNALRLTPLGAPA